MLIKSEVLEGIPEVLHGFGTADEPVSKVLSERWLRDRPVWRQVHGSAIACVQSFRQDCGEVDAFFSSGKDIPIGIATADCVPILLAHRQGKTVAAVHAGWRGTQAHILRVLWKEMRLRGEVSRNWVAAVGPAIGPCCYEVSEDLAEDFRRDFAHLGSGIAVPKDRTLDLPAIHAAELERLGFKQIDLIRICTRCSVLPLLNSYRRDPQCKARQYSIIMKRGFC